MRKIKNYLRKITVGILSLLLASFFVSCEKDEDLRPDYNTAIKAEAIFGSGMKKASENADITIDRFSVVISEIEFEFEDDDPIRDEDIYDDFELRGPFYLDLMDNGTSLEELITSVNLPQAMFDEIEFDLEPGTDPDSDMFGKTVYIEGTINGIPFIFWDDEDYDFELDFDDSEILNLEAATSAVVTLLFDLNQVFGMGMGGTDLGQLLDMDEDGIIEIHPGSDDGYSDLADELWDRFKDSIEAIEEEDDDDDDDYDDDDDDDDDYDGDSYEDDYDYDDDDD